MFRRLVPVAWHFTICVVLTTGGPLTASETTSPPNGAALTQRECGACHMVFPPQLLPKVSWLNLLINLKDHFGENATLDPETVLDIADYLSANAADAPDSDPRLLRGLDPDAPPLRITETPYWIRRHHELSPEDFAAPKVKSKSNCLACHRRGSFSDH